MSTVTTFPVFLPNLLLTFSVNLRGRGHVKITVHRDNGSLNETPDGTTQCLHTSGVGNTLLTVCAQSAICRAVFTHRLVHARRAVTMVEDTPRFAPVRSAVIAVEGMHPTASAGSAAKTDRNSVLVAILLSPRTSRETSKKISHFANKPLIGKRRVSATCYNAVIASATCAHLPEPIRLNRLHRASCVWRNDGSPRTSF